MKKLIIILMLLPIFSIAQTKVENFCYTQEKQLIGSLYSNPDTVAYFTDVELQPEYNTLKIIICDVYEVVYDDVTSFIYQNTSQSGVAGVERFGLKTDEADNYRWIVIEYPTFSESQLYAINDFGEKLKTIINSQ